jgi:hypothetical protein
MMVLSGHEAAGAKPGLPGISVVLQGVERMLNVLWVVFLMVKAPFCLLVYAVAVGVIEKNKGGILKQGTETVDDFAILKLHIGIVPYTEVVLREKEMGQNFGQPGCTDRVRMQRRTMYDAVLLTLQGLISKANIVCTGEPGLRTELIVGAENGGVEGQALHNNSGVIRLRAKK